MCHCISSDIEKIIKYDYFIKKNKKWWNHVFSRNLKNLALNIFIYLRLIFLCDSIEIRQFHTYSRYHQRIKYTLTNYFIRFSTMLYEAFPAETRLRVCRGAPVQRTCKLARSRNVCVMLKQEQLELRGKLSTSLPRRRPRRALLKIWSVDFILWL